MMELPIAQLFPIDVRGKKNVEPRDAFKLAAQEILQVVQDMADEKTDVGHILCFTPGNQRMNDVKIEFQKMLKGVERAEDRRKIKCLTKLSDSVLTQDEFYGELEIEVGDDVESLFVVVMTYAGFLNDDQKAIAREPIRYHPNVIKVILATNAIESSITIMGLAAVIDTGLCNHGVHDPDRGLTTVTERPISKQSQEQRKGRVGRVMRGIAVQITGKRALPDHFPAAIETSDLSADILQLRSIGIHLEDLQNLPQRPQNVDGFIRELIMMKALDPQKELTERGRQLGKFHPLSPFHAYAILEASRDDSSMQTLGALAVLVMTAKNLCDDVLAPKLQENFHEDSDVITLLKTVIWCAQMKPPERLRRSKEHGLVVKEVKRIACNTFNIHSSLMGDGENERTMWQRLSAVTATANLLEFVNSLLMGVQKVKPDWLGVRRIAFKTVANTLKRPRIEFTGNPELETVEVAPRPGAPGLSCPGACVCLSLEHKPERQMTIGSMLHKDWTKNGQGVVSVCEDRFMMSDFTIPLIDAYLGDSKDYVKFYRFAGNAGPNAGGVSCYLSPFCGRVAFSFAHRSQAGKDRMLTAIAVTKK
jgi:HrpA-like RNA helicase